MLGAPKNPALAAIPRGLLVELDERRRILEREGKRLVDLGVGDPREPTPAFVRDALLASVSSVSQYPSPFGTPALRAAAAGYLQRRFGVRVDPEQEAGIVVAPGRSFGPAGEGFVRVALVPALADCEDAIRVWEGVR